MALEAMKMENKIKTSVGATTSANFFIYNKKFDTIIKPKMGDL